MAKAVRTSLWAWAIAILSPVGILSQEPNDTTSPSPPGQLVDVGGYRLHIRCMGNGTPAVVLIHGLMDFSLDWALVQPELTRFTRVCAFDRAGETWSDPPPSGLARRDLRTIAGELRTVLDRARVPGPYILVGHAWGGLVARLYASQHPRDVAGMVLVEATHEDQWMETGDTTVRPRLTTAEEWDRIRRRPTRKSPSGSPILAGRGDSTLLSHPFNALPVDVQQQRVWAMSKSARGGREDWGGVRDDFLLVHASRAGKSPPHGDIPLVAIIAGVHVLATRGAVTTRQILDQMVLDQADLLTLSRSARRVTATYSGHYVHLVEPDLVVEAIRQVIEAARGEGKFGRNR